MDSGIIIDEYKAQRFIQQHLTRAGQNPRRIRLNIHKWGLQFDGGIISNSGNPVLVWNFLGRSNHRSAQKHKNELVHRGITEFEIPLSSVPRMMLSVKEMTDYVEIRRKCKRPLTCRNHEGSVKNVRTTTFLIERGLRVLGDNTTVEKDREKAHSTIHPHGYIK